jgi:hypothetical protein
VPSSDPLALVDAALLSEEEARYVGAARAANTLRGYRSDWKEWCLWCISKQVEPLNSGPTTLSHYLTFLAGHGAAVGTMSSVNGHENPRAGGHENCALTAIETAR